MSERWYPLLTALVLCELSEIAVGCDLYEKIQRSISREPSSQSKNPWRWFISDVSALVSATDCSGSL